MKNKSLMDDLPIKLIRKYQAKVSPFLEKQGYKCLFETTCSQYALRCFEKYSLFKATILSFYRVISCNPINAFIKQRKEVIYG